METASTGAAAASETNQNETTPASTASVAHTSTAEEVQEPPAPRRSPRRSAAAQKRAEGITPTDHGETERGEAAGGQSATEPVGAVAETSQAPQPMEALAQPAAAQPAAPVPTGGVVEQAELAASPAAAMAQPPAADLLGTALTEIPRLASPDALERCRQRVNRLLAEGQLNDEDAERLWNAIDRRLQQLQDSGPARTPEEVS